MSAADLQRLIDEPAARLDASALELCDALLARIAGEALGAFIFHDPDGAREAARRSDARRARGRRHGPLDGLPVAIKDNIDVAGAPASSGSAWFRGRRARRDAVVAAALRRAGAVILGTLNLHELAYGATTANPHFGLCRNPWDRERIAGGSSGGSGAALGADLCLAALGTDTGGSVRLPAALCGVSGVRPTLGGVSNRGVRHIGPSLDTVGAMARSVTDLAAVHRAIAGFDPRDPTSIAAPAAPVPQVSGAGARPLSGLTVAVADGWFFDEVEPAVAGNARAAADALAELGARVGTLDTRGAGEVAAACGTIIRAEALALHQRRLDRAGDALGEDVRRRLHSGARITGVELARATARIREWGARMRVALSRVDILLSPTAPAVAPRHDAVETIATTGRLTSLTLPASGAGLPAISLPSGAGAGGLPTGVQLAAAPWREELLFEVAAAYQRLTDWHRRRPPDH